MSYCFNFICFLALEAKVEDFSTRIYGIVLEITPKATADSANKVRQKLILRLFLQ